MRHLILGTGPAGVTAAETLRASDPRTEITLIGEEPGAPYARMALPYLLTGRIGEAGVHIRTADDHYQRLGIRRIEGRASRLDTKAKLLTLIDGQKLAYDRLLIATGSRPLKPPVSGLDKPNVHHCWTIADARNIIRLAQPGRKVVLMGAGFIGCIILEALALRKVDLTVIEAGPRMVPRMMDEVAGGMLQRWCQAKGVTVLTGAAATAVEGGPPLSVKLGDGRVLAADLVVVATGVTPNAEFLDGSGVKLERGIKVDNHLRTTGQDVFAAGDVAEGPDFGGGRAVHAIQPTAVEQGRVAALNMAGGDVFYQGSLAMNVLDTLGLVSASFGQWQGAPYGGIAATAVDEARYRYIKLCFEDDRLVGAIAVGRTEHIGVLRGLIQSRTPLGPWKDKLLSDPHRIMEAYLARGQAAA